MTNTNLPRAGTWHDIHGTDWGLGGGEQPIMEPAKREKGMVASPFLLSCGLMFEDDGMARRRVWGTSQLPFREEV
jgi:hypothetical protein